MLEIGMAVGICMIMAKIADADGRSAFTWGAIAVLICIGCLAVPLPFIRFLIARAVAFGCMMVTKALQGL